LIVAPYPLDRPKHGGQVRAATMMSAIQLAGWQVDGLGIYFSGFFPASERGPLDIVIEAPELQKSAMADIVFADFHAARSAASDRNAIKTLEATIQRLMPDLIHIEQPWPWLLLREALPSRHNIRIVYSSHNIESKARRPLFHLGMKNASSEKMLEATRLLEDELARTADLVVSISDIEAVELERASGRPAVYLPPVSKMGATKRNSSHKRFAQEARAAGCRYAAIMGSAYWPNVEGFFSIFPEGFGFLAPGEQIWLAGTMANSVSADERFQRFLSINESRTRILGYLDDAETEGFFSAAKCVVVPVKFGAGAKMKTADAIASGLPVIATEHAIEGYGPIVKSALNRGIYVADTPKTFRRLMLNALREGLPGCSPEVRAQVGLEAMARTWAHYANGLIGRSPPRHAIGREVKMMPEIEGNV